jgi:multicomponent Na+:H+ antiporter subunit E
MTERKTDIQCPPQSAPLDRRARVAWALRVAGVLLVVWMALTGGGAWLVGIPLALAGGATAAWLAPADHHPWKVSRLPQFFGFFLRESLLGGLDVARRALRPKVDVAPCFVVYPLGLPPGQPRTLMVCLVSLLPGTLSADLDTGRGLLLVHALAPEAVATVPALELRVARLFGLELQAGTAQPCEGRAFR